MMLRSVLLILVGASLKMCSAERLRVDLDRASIVSADGNTLFLDVAPEAGRDPLRRALRLDFSSQVDLVDYFESRRLQTQVRCSVHGSADGKDYTGYGSDVAVTKPQDGDPEGKHRYTTYAFVDFQSLPEDQTSEPDSRLDLTRASFDAVSCFVIGVDVLPLPVFPRSNDLVVSSDTFRSLAR